MIAAFTTTDWILLLVILVLLGLLIFMSLAEMGLSRMTKPKAAAIAERRKRQGAALVDLVEHPERWINPLLLSVNVCQTVQATLTGVVAARAFGAIGVVIGVLLNVIVFFVLAEAVPKTYAVLHADRAALLTARPIRLLVTFAPLRWISQMLIKLTNVIVRGKGLEEGPFVREQEFLGHVDAALEDEVIEEEERDLIESVIEFGDTVAREIMTPLPDMVTIGSKVSVAEAIGVAIEHGFSRLPVVDEEKDDDVVGVAVMKDLVREQRAGRGSDAVLIHARHPRIIPENKSVSKLMREMQTNKFHLAVVADEYGSITGMVTLEDCLEELVGEIVDEYDDHELDIVPLADGGYLIDGSAPVADVNELLAIRLPDEEWDSIGGYVFGTLGRVPTVGEWVDGDGWRFEVVQLEGRRIRKIEVTLSPESGPIGSSDDPGAVPGK